MAMNPMALLGLLQMADPETIELLKKLVNQVKAAPNTNEALKLALKRATAEYDVVEIPRSR